MKSIVAETDTFSYEANEKWHAVYENSIKLLGECCAETLCDIDAGQELGQGRSDSFRALHEFLFPIAGQLQLEYSYEPNTYEGGESWVIFCIHDISDKPDLYVDDNVAEALDKIRLSVTDASFVQSASYGKVR